MSKQSISHNNPTCKDQLQDQLFNDNADQQDDDNECWDDARQESDSCYLNSFADNNDNKPQASSSALSSCRVDFSTEKEGGDLLLHEAVFNNDASKIYDILKKEDWAKSIVNKKDKHGNTALHLACMLGRSKEIVGALLQCGAGVDVKNLHRWTPFHEACSYGDREVITLLTKRLKDDVHDVIHKNKLSENLEKTKNYRLVLKWEFDSWIPLLARVLPNDTCVITKIGSSIRIDTSLLDFELLSWKRGECSLVYSRDLGRRWMIMNNKTKKYQYFETKNLDTKDIDTKVDNFMSADIIDLELKFTDLQLTRSTSGWIWKADRVERVGKYNAALYIFNNVFLVTRKRREHLSEEEVRRNKIACKGMMSAFIDGEKSRPREVRDELDTNSGNNDDSNDKYAEPKHRQSLPPPPASNFTWKQYCEAEPGEFPPLGRPVKCKVNKTALKASVAMSEEFPITKNEFLDLLSIIPLKIFKKLKEFIELRLPEGFPVRLDIPIYSFLTARVAFDDFAFISDDSIDMTLFSVPSDYLEDPNLFPLLSGKSMNHEIDH